MIRSLRCKRRLILGTVALLVFAGSALGDANITLAEAKRLFAKGEFEQSFAAARVLWVEKPHDPEVVFWLGRAALEAGDTLTATQELRRAADMRPRSAEWRYWVGVASERAGRLGEALEAYRQALRLDGQHDASLQACKRLLHPNARESRFPHHAVALEAEGGLEVDRQQADVISPHIYDYTFSTAPTDWTMELGDWRVRSRWSCTPSWNFMGGEGPMAVAIWNRREFLGDVTVEAYMSYKMNVMGEGGYRNGTDFNVTLCGDGRNLFSGYVFIIGGWGNSWTRIMKGNKVLAETNSPDHKPVTLLDGSPGSWEWHRRWWEVRAVKRGEDLYLFFDNALVLQAHDPEPLPGGRVALWTYDNGIMIPRVKIYFEKERPAGERGEPPYLPATMGSQQPSSPALVFSSQTHPSIRCSFDHDLGGWERRDGQYGALLSLDDLTPNGSGKCLLLTNEYSGGTFGATAVKGPFDAVRMNRLRFAYWVPEDAKVNLQLTAADTRYEIIFTAPEFPSDRARRLGHIPGVCADSRWHQADIDLLACLRRFYPDAPSIEVKDLWFGLDTSRNYVLAGCGANPALAQYRIDEFEIWGAGVPEGEVRVTLADAESEAGRNVARYEYVLADKPEVQPKGALDSANGNVTFSGLANGLHYLNVRAVGNDNTVGPTYSYPIAVDTSPPEVVSLSPPPDSATDGEEFNVWLTDDCVGVNPASVSFLLNDAPLGSGRAGFSYDPISGLAQLIPGKAGLNFAPDKPIRLTLATAADWRGNSLAEPLTWEFTYERALDNHPPAAPVVALPQEPLCADDFEEDLGVWQPYSASIPAALTLDESTAASGRRSLRVYNPASGGAMGAVPYPRPFDAGVYRLISFDYKLRPEVRVDLYAVVNGTGYSVKLSNNDSPNYIGSFSDVQLDDQWHHAEVNLYELLRAADPTAPGYIVTTLAFMDAGNYGNIQHQYYNIDNFTIRPIMALTDGAELPVSVGDPSGIGGVSYCVDTSPVTEPTTAIRSPLPLISLSPIPGSDFWLHTKAIDGAGNWGATAHQRLLVDGVAPAASIGSPSPGDATAVSEITVPLIDTGSAGIDPRSIQLEVGGTTYTVQDQGLIYDSSSGQLIWNCEHTSGGPVVFQNGQQVSVRLLAAADYAGNLVSSLPAWSWTMDYSKDVNPPVIAALSSPSHATLIVERFEKNAGEVRPYGSASSAQITRDDPSPDGTGHSVSIRNATAGGNMAFYLITTNIATNLYPYISFDYRIPPNVTLDMLVYFYNEVLVFQLNGNAGGYFASVPGIVADGQWHHCTFNLYEPIAQRAAQRGLGAYYMVSYVALVHRDSTALPEGASVNLDNLVISASGASLVDLSWSATDTTGIAGYSYVIDQAPNTEAPTTVVATTTGAQFPDRPSGLNWFHIRAIDGAGNWGPTTHWAVHVE